jgi:polysaccharide biosynthesis protein PslG
LHRRLGVLAVALAVAAGLAVPAANAQRGMLVGLQDDAMVLRGNPVFTFGLLRQLRVQIVRMNLNWPDVAKRRPAHPQDPADPAYDWDLYDRAIRYAAQNRMQVLLTILFTPSWANGGKQRNVPPSNFTDLRNFAYAAASRYSGHYIPNTDDDNENYLPAVKYWLAWNEPNNPNWLQQTAGGRFVSPRSYARICTAIWTGVHFTNFAGEKVGCGATGPRGNNQARSSRPSMSPLAFMAAARKAGMRRMDAYAHHPYYGRPSEAPSWNPRGGTAIELGNLRTLIKQSNKLFGRKPIWITEYAYQTPPDRQFGVSFSRQAKYVGQAYGIARATPQVSMMVWFMLRDDTNLSLGWQSGFLTASGKKKPSFNVFARLRH